jgi:hypothetical protein
VTKKISKKTNIKRSQVYEDYDEYIYLEKYLNLDAKDFCCKLMYENLLGEDNGECELHFGYSPHFREYYINIKAEFGGAAVHLIFYCPWCGTKLPSSLRAEFFATFEKVFGIHYGDIKSKAKIPSEFKSDKW